MNNFWKDKIVLLTGASSGIGEALAIAIAKEGATVGLFARREELLENIAEKCETAGGTARVFAGDVVDLEILEKAAVALENEFGKIDILIANAGIGGMNVRTLKFQADAVKEVIDINLIGTVNAVSAVLPGMFKNGSGQIVGISSLAGIRGLPKSAAYSASKAGMTAFLESVRLDVRENGIDVSIILPGFIKTPLTSGRSSKMPFLMELEDSVPYFLRAIEKRKRFAAFPWQLATIVRLARFLPASVYDLIAGRARYRE